MTHCDAYTKKPELSCCEREFTILPWLVSCNKKADGSLALRWFLYTLNYVCFNNFLGRLFSTCWITGQITEAGE